MRLSSSIKIRPFDWLGQSDIAHRGLHDGTQECPENSLPAINKAADQGYSVEIDVRLTKDEQVVVYHDRTLDRLCGRPDAVDELTLAELRTINILGGKAQIACLDDALDAVGGRVPLYIEAKSERGTNVSRLCAGIRRALEGYLAPVAIMSFDPRIVEWLALNTPEKCRGLVVSEDAVKAWHAGLTNMFLLNKLRPDFLACDIDILPNKICRRWRSQGRKLLTWTIKSKAQAITGRKHADALIFEDV